MERILRKAFQALSPKIYWKEVLALLMLLLAIVFFRSERKELGAIIPEIIDANGWWLLVGFALTLFYFFMQGGIYKKCFAAIGLFLQWGEAVDLFLKRNFISVFLPAGGVSALAFTPSQIRKAGFTNIQVHQASALFWFVGILTVFIAGLPVVGFNFFHAVQFKSASIGLVILLLFLSGILVVVNSLKRKRGIFNWINKMFPSIAPTIDELFGANVNMKKLQGATLYSIGVELSGMLHVYIAMLALGLPASFGVAASAYIIAVLMMLISPFLRGLGAVELAMVFVLEKFDYSSVQALSVTVLYRVFEFWLPLLAGLVAFAWKGRKIFFRLAPALLTFLLGIVNIISVVTPPGRYRLHLLKNYIPETIIHASNLLVLFIGLFLLLTSAFLFRGLRNAWLIALVFSIASLVGHVTKALDYEEAIVAGITAVVLITTASQYRIRSSSKWMQVGMKTAVLSFAAVLLFGFICFYFIDIKHFGIDFTWQESIVHTMKSFLLIEDVSLHPVTKFGHEFIWLIRVLGFLTWSFLLFTIIRPHFNKTFVSESQKEKAKFLLNQFGNSSNDYFKTYRDKLYFFSDRRDAFIAYRIAGGFAIVLEEPVCAEENKIDVLAEFDRHCRKMGLKPAFYRVAENSIPWFNKLMKKKLIIGQEAILELNSFSLEGKDKKSLRNGLNSLKKNGFTVNVSAAPQSAEYLMKLRKVSDEWLESFGKQELVFSQGMFYEIELQQQDIITLNDADGNIKAFLNLIPDYAEDECTYDLIRKTIDAPAASMDALIIKLIEYAKEKKYLFLNLGMVPMTGITQPGNTAEQIIKLAAEKIKRFQHYKGLKEFKEKYATLWENKYLVYDNDFDLLQLPVALNTVMKP